MSMTDNNIVDFKEAKEKIKNNNLEKMRLSQPMLYDYMENRKQYVLIYNALQGFVKEFESTVLCFSDERKIPFDNLLLYLSFKGISFEIVNALKKSDEEVKNYFPSFNPED